MDHNCDLIRTEPVKHSDAGSLDSGSALDSIRLASTVNLNSVRHLFPLISVESVDTSQSASTQSAVRSTSYLENFTQTALSPITNIVDLNLGAGGEPVQYAKGFIKTLPLLMRGRTAFTGLVLAHALDEAKIGDRAKEQLIDAGLGVSKALTLKGTFNYFGVRGSTPAATGVGLGIVGRASEVGLTRRNYYDQDGSFDLMGGLRNSASVALNPASLAFDAATFGAADILWARMFNWSRGTVWYRPEVRSSIIAGTMGLTTGFSFELQRQMVSDQGISFSELARKSAIQGTLDAIAGGIGGLQARRQMRLAVQKDAPDAVLKARSTAFQRGELANKPQMALRDGQFILDQGVKGLSVETWIGWVKTGEGRYIRTVFRPDDGTESFAHRMQSEIASYGMGQLGFKSNVPVTVARHVEINGKKYPGYIQEMEGPSLAEFARYASGNPGRNVTRKDLLESLLSNSSFRDSYTDAWLHRMIAGEWDNHALNMAVRQLVHKPPSVRNIDLGDAFRRAQTQLDLVPTPGVRQGYDMINAHLYRELAGTKLPAEKVANFRELHQRFKTPEGREQLQSLGFTPQQVEGILGRIQWFVQNGVMPRQREPAFYLHLNDARRWWDSALGGAKSRTSLILNSIEQPAKSMRER